MKKSKVYLVVASGMDGGQCYGVFDSEHLAKSHKRFLEDEKLKLYEKHYGKDAKRILKNKNSCGFGGGEGYEIEVRNLNEGIK